MEGPAEAGDEPVASYVVKAENLRDLIQQIDDLKDPVATLDYRLDLVEHLLDPEFRRIKWFFYCDDRTGNTIRVFDRRFLERYRNLFKTADTEKHVLLRGKRLGEENGETKRKILDLFSEHLKAKGLTWKGEEKDLDYFEKLNSESHDAEGEMTLADEDGRPNEHSERYKALERATFLRPLFFSRLERLLEDHKQVILEGPPGSGKTFVAREFAKWWTQPQESGAGEGSHWGVVQFHESYGYEDFFQGIRPQLLNSGKVIASSDTETPVDKMVYRNCPGIFHEFCMAAARAEDARFVLVIDEINRGKASRIFG
jgi:hypothetical protein